jgi:predicted signal transduction protein with EAL and GGDEF domain
MRRISSRALPIRDHAFFEQTVFEGQLGHSHVVEAGLVLVAELHKQRAPHLQGVSVQRAIDASVGIALAPIDGETAEQLLANADVALYQAKEDGRRTFRFFQPGMGVSLRAHRALELDLRNALGAGELEV